MSIPVPTTIATGFDDAVGSAYRQATDQLLIVDAGSGAISAISPHTYVKTALGTGYNAPSDIVLSVDGLHAYVTEKPGTLLSVSLSNWNRAAATVVASGLNGVDQVALDEAHGVAYVTEFTGGHLQQINLTTGVKASMAAVFAPRGVLVTSDGRSAYVSSDAGTITRFDFATNTSIVIASGLNGPRHLTWADGGESAILFPQPNPIGTVLKLDLTASPALVTPIAGPAPAFPYSVVVVSPNQILITSATAISQVDRLAAMYGSLRAQILSRHFALGRHFRADHLSFYNNLGVVHQDGSGNTDNQKNDLVVGCIYSGATIQQPPVDETIWIQDQVPAGAVLGVDTGIPGGAIDVWQWISQNPVPKFGRLAHQSAILAGLHQHFFFYYERITTMHVASGDNLFAYVYLDPNNPPREVMLQWYMLGGSDWGHRAYWGENLVVWGVEGTASHYFMGPLPLTGQWVRLEVPARLVGLEDCDVNGMAFTLWDGRATWDRAGKGSANAAGLLNLSDSDRLFERWRVADHARENPLMYSGQLMTCLAVECMLGIPGSKEVLRRLIATTKSLFKFSQEPYKGYILRWDPVTSDRWTTLKGQNGVLLDHCCDFLTDSNRAGGYLYCTPLDDPRYTPYISESAFQKLSDIEKENYHNARLATIQTYYRAWEPSMDELVGLVAGYDFVHRVVSDPDVVAEVKSQVQQLGTYLAANAYLLVRPEGGFSARGASGVLPAFEFHFGRVFSRITGSDFSAQTGFEGALQNAGLWSYFSDAFALATVGGWPISIVTGALLGVLGPLFGPLIPTLIGLVGGVPTAKALAVLLCNGSVDVGSFPGDGSKAFPGNRDEQNEFALAYLLLQVPKSLRFTSWLSAIARFGAFTSGNHFPPFIGLTGIGDADLTVRSAYLDWLSARRAKNDPPQDDEQYDLVPNYDAFASAVAVLLGAGSAEESKLVSLLEGLRKEFEEKRKGELALIDSVDSVNGSKFVQEPIRPAMNFLSAVALAWYHSMTQSAAGSPIPARIGFPNPPPRGSTLPTPIVPGAVIKMTSKYNGGNTPEQVIALAGLPPLGSPPDEVDLFSDAAPGKPSDPPPPMSTVRWLYTGATSFSGNIFGSSGTDVINAGKRVGGSACTILGIKLELVDKHGVPLGGPSTTTTLGRPDAVDGFGPLNAGARIVAWSSLTGAWDGTITNEVSHGTTNDETVTVQWWYSSGLACRFRLGYLVRGTNCSL